MNLQTGHGPIAARYCQPPLLYQTTEYGEISDIVRRVPTYQSLESRNIRLESVAIDRILPVQMVLTQYKLRRAEYVIKLHTQLDSKLFSPVPISESMLASRTKLRHHVYQRLVLWLPPVVEAHNDDFILIDGHHRFYALCARQSTYPTTVQVVVVHGVTEPLPCTPQRALAEWIESVTIDDAQYSRGREYRYVDYEPSHWRDFKAMRPNNRRLPILAR